MDIKNNKEDVKKDMIDYFHIKVYEVKIEIILDKVEEERFLDHKNYNQEQLVDDLIIIL